MLVVSPGSGSEPEQSAWLKAGFTLLVSQVMKAPPRGSWAGTGGADGPHFVKGEGCETGVWLVLVYASLPTLRRHKHTVQTFVPLA